MADEGREQDERDAVRALLNPCHACGGVNGFHARPCRVSADGALLSPVGRKQAAPTERTADQQREGGVISSVSDAAAGQAFSTEGGPASGEHGAQTGRNQTSTTGGAVSSSTQAERLFGVPGAEELHLDIGAAYESQIDPYFDDDSRPRVIEEWTVCPPAAHLRSAQGLVDWLVEDASENAGVDGYYDSAEHLTRNPEVLAAAEALIAALAERVTYRVADRRVSEHAVTWDAAGEPLVDDKPLYVKRPADA